MDTLDTTVCDQIAPEDSQIEETQETSSSADVLLDLLPHHEQLLTDSAIDRQIAYTRGYRSITRKTDLEDLGFSPAQRRVPTLVIPVHSVTGDIALHQIRPDRPRTSKDGKTIKYETPKDAKMALDVHPSIRTQLGNPHIPFFITEGVRKADAAISHGLCCIALLGVTTWRGTNGDGGKTALPDWEYVALKDRDVYIVFDSEVMLKRPVYNALIRLFRFLAHRGALVKVIYLEPRADGGKVGLDDFFVAGHTTENLLARATTDLREPPVEEENECSYHETPTGIVWKRPMQEGTIDVPLCNFSARIVTDIIEDDGVETHRQFEIEARQHERRATVRVSADRFNSLGWSVEALGARAIMYPGQTLRDHTRAAIQLLSSDVHERRVFKHTGWRTIDGTWHYLHAGGAIGRAGNITEIEVSLPEALDRYTLPDPPVGKERLHAIENSLRMIDVAPDHITYPVYAEIWRTVFGDMDFAIHLAGPSGQGKTEIAALAQQHFGASLDARHLPASWSSTGNSLEGIAFATKDALLVIDDFCPTGSSADIQRLHRDADRILRAQGNHSGRLRMRADATLSAAKPPRGGILSTGEDSPRGLSLRARMVILEISPGVVIWEQLTECQQHAVAGDYTQALAAFLQWVAPQYEKMRERIKRDTLQLRSTVIASHRRIAGSIASLAAGFSVFLDFAREIGAISETQKIQHEQRCWNALVEAAGAQEQQQQASDPVPRFITLLSNAISSGRAHIANMRGEEPTDSQGWGWRENGESFKPHGERVGWVDNDNLYLLPDASFAVAQKLGRDQDETLPVTQQTLRKRLNERGYLVSTESVLRGTLTVRRQIEGQRREVLHFRTTTLSHGLFSKPDQPDHDQHDHGRGGLKAPHNEESSNVQNPTNRFPTTTSTQENGMKSNTSPPQVGLVGSNKARTQSSTTQKPTLASAGQNTTHQHLTNPTIVARKNLTRDAAGSNTVWEDEI
ncbi:MAG: DUF3854 domain-containing protein [Candidatus Binatia bacterium]